MERGDQGWCDQETASTLGQRRRRWGTIMVHSSHGPSHGSPRRVAPDHMLLAGSTATLAPGATARLHSLPASACSYPGAMLLPPRAVIHLNTISSGAVVAQVG